MCKIAKKIVQFPQFRSHSAHPSKTNHTIQLHFHTPLRFFLVHLLPFIAFVAVNGPPTKIILKFINFYLFILFFFVHHLSPFFTFTFIFFCLFTILRMGAQWEQMGSLESNTLYKIKRYQHFLLHDSILCCTCYFVKIKRYSKHLGINRLYWYQQRQNILWLY